MPDPSIAALAAAANPYADMEEETDDQSGSESEDDEATGISASLRLHAKSLRDVIERSDVIVQVLDARDPNGTRSKKIEREAIQVHGKKLVLVLNKIGERSFRSTDRPDLAIRADHLLPHPRRSRPQGECRGMAGLPPSLLPNTSIQVLHPGTAQESLIFSWQLVSHATRRKQHLTSAPPYPPEELLPDWLAHDRRHWIPQRR